MLTGMTLKIQKYRHEYVRISLKVAEDAAEIMGVGYSGDMSRNLIEVKEHLRDAKNIMHLINFTTPQRVRKILMTRVFTTMEYVNPKVVSGRPMTVKILYDYIKLYNMISGLPLSDEVYKWL